MKKSKLKVFYSHGMGNDKKDIIEFFKKLLKEKFDVLEGEEPTETTMHKATLEKIDQSDFIFAVFSKRDEVKHRNENSDEIVSCYKIPPGVIYETGYAKATGKLGVPVYVAIEEEIPISSSTIGMVYFDSPKDANSSICIWSFPPDIKELDSRKEKRKFRDRLINIEQELKQEIIQTPYNFIRAETETTIFNTGYDITRMARTVLVKCDKPSLSFKHELNIELDRKSQNLSSFFSQDKKKMIKAMVLYTPSEGYKNNVVFFSKEIVKNIRGVAHSLKLKDFKINKKNDLSFRFDFKIVATGPFRKGDQFTYEYAMGIPDYYIFSCPQEDAFTFPSTKTHELIFKISFEKGLDKFRKKPTYTIYDAATGEDTTIEKQQFEKIGGAVYTTFAKKIETRGGAFLPKAEAIATWRWK